MGLVPIQGKKSKVTLAICWELFYVLLKIHMFLLWELVSDLHERSFCS